MVSVQKIIPTQPISKAKTGIKKAAQKVSEHVQEYSEQYNTAAAAVTIAGLGTIVAKGAEKHLYKGDMPYTPEDIESSSAASDIIEAATDGKTEVIKTLGANDWIEKSGDQYFHTHIGYGDANIVRTPVDPAEYGIEPEAVIPHVSAAKGTVFEEILNGASTKVDITNAADIVSDSTDVAQEAVSEAAGSLFSKFLQKAAEHADELSQATEVL